MATTTNRWGEWTTRAAQHGIPLAALALTAFLLGAVSGSSAEVPAVEAPVIRVLLTSSREAFAVRAPVPMAVQDPRTRATLAELPAGTHLVSRKADRFVIGAMYVTGNAMRLTAAGGKPLGVLGKSWPGSLSVHADAGGTLSVVNLVDLETYVAGVVGNEIGFSAPPEAQKAQAVAARTYAVARARVQRATAPTAVFDLYADTRSQVYGGVCANEKVWQAVWATRAAVMTDDGKVFTAYYHATCGGLTEAAAQVFPKDRCAPLAGGVRCDGCKGAARRYWTATLSEWKIRTRLRGAGYALDRLTAITPLEATPGGRVARLRLSYGSAGRSGSLQMATQDFRAIAGDDAIRSTRFRVVRAGDGYRFEGEGWGHGVGLCQEGAIGAARAGRDWKQILQQYYPGHALAPAYGG